MVVPPFSTYRVPQVLFGPGTSLGIADQVALLGMSCLVVTGGESLERSGRLARLEQQLGERNVKHAVVRIAREPTTCMIDAIVAEHRTTPPGVVLAIGGGSVIDAGKAVAALIPSGDPVELYLELPGGAKRAHDGAGLPLLAVPTTAGAGSEATANAVIGRDGAPGSPGYKASLRHPGLVPALAILDPDLLMGAPQRILAAGALDPLTQLLESHLSPTANPVSSCFALQGLRSAGRALCQVSPRERLGPATHSDLMFAAFCSGVSLAQAGLGIVHGLAPILGSKYGVPHGVACGVLLAPAMSMNWGKMSSSDSPDSGCVQRMAEAASVLAGTHFASEHEACTWLTQTLADISKSLGMPSLADFGVSGLTALASAASLKNNPVPLSITDIETILQEGF